MATRRPALISFANVPVRGMIRHTAHRHVVPLGQRDIQQSRRFFRVLEKHLVKIAQPKKQQRVRRNAFPQPLVLLHHRSKRVLHNGIYLASLN